MTKRQVIVHALSISCRAFHACERKDGELKNFTDWTKEVFAKWPVEEAYEEWSGQRV